jgi:phage-related protein
VKPLQFISSSEDDLAAFPREVKQVAGYQLYRVQAGLMPSDWKPMLNVGAGAYEIRVHVLGEWRVIYVAKFADAVYVLHVFQKKTQQTRKEDIDLAAARYKLLKENTK